MRKYIDADKLIAEIERRKVEWKALFDNGENTVAKECFYEDENILNFITSLQQEQPQVTDTSKMEQEVDLKKEYKEYVEDDPVFSKLTNRNVGLAIARHFWNKGYNARNKK